MYYKLPHIRGVREAVPLTQQELAKLSGVGLRTIKRTEAGGGVYASTLRALAKALKVKSADLMER